MGNNTGGRAVMLWLIRFLYAGVWISAGLPLCTCTIVSMHTEFCLVQNVNCTRPSRV
jgi:hypothetical protein